MTPHPTPPRRPIPVRYGSRYGTPAMAGVPTTDCPLCQAPLPAARARYCSDACKQRAYRRRQAQGSAPSTSDRPGALQEPDHPRAQAIYACPDCDARYVGERRCPDCNRFCRKLGLGGTCPHCDEPVLLAELLGKEGLL